MSWFDAHAERLERAVQALRARDGWSPFVESPSRRLHPEGAAERGRLAFEARLGRPFDLELPGTDAWIGAEVSPWTGAPLGITYPRARPERLMEAAERAMGPWVEAGPRVRVGLCMEWLHRLSLHAFEGAHATMHTAGQSFLMAFAGSGANSLDRGLEALAMAWRLMSEIPESSTVSRRFGAGEARVRRRYDIRPRGVAVVMSCATYPAWNAWPAVTANLATGNAVVLKPHPDCVLPVAMAVATGRALLEASGFSPDLLTLAVDSRDAPVARALMGHDACGVVDFTGGAAFGSWIEQHVRGPRIFTETSGVNSVILESCDDLDAVLETLAHGLSTFSGQMCTTPQNLWVPREGVWEGARRVPPEALAERLVAAVDALVADPDRAQAVCGAIASPRTTEMLADLTMDGHACGTLLRSARPYALPGARTATPLILRAEPEDIALHGEERFGPAAFFIVARDLSDALDRASAAVRRRGAIATHVYSVKPEVQDAARRAFTRVGASLSLNLLATRPMQFAGAFVDFHVTGLNPAGTACLTDAAFVAPRFAVVQTREELRP